MGPPAGIGCQGIEPRAPGPRRPCRAIAGKLSSFETILDLHPRVKKKGNSLPGPAMRVGSIELFGGPDHDLGPREPWLAGEERPEKELA